MRRPTSIPGRMRLASERIPAVSSATCTSAKEASLTSPLAAKIAREYGTPALVIDMDRVERNIARVQKICDAVGVANRPHIKTHKSPFLAQLQIEAGAKGITCQKLASTISSSATI